MPRIKQVFLNIINNAVYAMKDGGSLTIRTTAGTGTAHIAFEDTGPGIPAEILARIFDPFFTTKPEVSGTGLGLSVSLGIVQSHGGTIDVKSELGTGTTFTVTLPSPTTPTRPPPTPRGEPPRSGTLGRARPCRTGRAQSWWRRYPRDNRHFWVPA